VDSEGLVKRLETFDFEEEIDFLMGSALFTKSTGRSIVFTKDVVKHSAFG
jgi:hypothetical protein